MKQIQFQMPVTNWKTKKFVGNITVAYSFPSGDIEFVSWGDTAIRVTVDDLIQAIAPDFWNDIKTAVSGHMEFNVTNIEADKEDFKPFAGTFTIVAPDKVDNVNAELYEDTENIENFYRCDLTDWTLVKLKDGNFFGLAGMGSEQGTFEQVVKYLQSEY